VRAANRVTLSRAGIAGLMVARALDPARLSSGERWLLAAIAVLALALDGVDGRAARRQGPGADPDLGPGDAASGWCDRLRGGTGLARLFLRCRYRHGCFPPYPERARWQSVCEPV
jgi:hypothetical protein